MLISFAAGCASATKPSGTQDVTSVTVTGLAPVVGGTSQLTAAAKMDNGSTIDVTSKATWTSSNPSVAVVSPVGQVNDFGAGSATITAAYLGVAGNLTLNIGQ
jgi:uncharacterized protein YjdB